MERVRAIVTPHVVSEAEYGPMAKVLAETVTADPDSPPKVQQLHHPLRARAGHPMHHFGSLQQVHVRVLNLLRKMLVVSDLKPLELWPPLEARGGCEVSAAGQWANDD
jgi:hypothetical protein